MSQSLSALLGDGPGTPQPDRAFRLLVAQRLAEAVQAVHADGGVIGNLDDHSVQVELDGTVTLSDNTEAAPEAIASASGYTAPELQGSLSSHARPEAQHDTFALAVLLFQLLMEGNHPYAGRWVGGGNLPEIPKAIQLGLYAYGSSSVTPPPDAPALSTLEPGLADLFKRSFGATSAIFRNRPTAAEWARTLATARQAGPTTPVTPATVAATEANPATPVSRGPAEIQPVAAPSREAQATTSVPIDAPARAGAPPVSPQPIVQDPPSERPAPHRSDWGIPHPRPAALPHADTISGENKSTSPVKHTSSQRMSSKQGVSPSDLSRMSRRGANPQPPEPAPDFSKIRRRLDELVHANHSTGGWVLLALILGGLMLWIRPSSGDTPRSPDQRPAIVRATRVPATQTPLPQPTTTRISVNNPTATSFEDDFDGPDNVIPSTGKDFSAYVKSKALRLEVFDEGGRGKSIFNYAPAQGDFHFTVRVGSITGQGEILLYVREPNARRTLVYAIDPARGTWSVFVESEPSSNLVPLVLPQDYGDIIASGPLRTITIARKEGKTSLAINGAVVSTRTARSMPGPAGPVTVGVGAMIPADLEHYDGENAVVTVDRVAMLADEG